MITQVLNHANYVDKSGVVFVHASAIGLRPCQPSAAFKILRNEYPSRDVVCVADDLTVTAILTIDRQLHGVRLTIEDEFRKHGDISKFRHNILDLAKKISALSPDANLSAALAKLLVESSPIPGREGDRDRQARIANALRDQLAMILPVRSEVEWSKEKFKTHMLKSFGRLNKPKVHALSCTPDMELPSQEFIKDFCELLLQITFNGIGRPYITEAEFQNALIKLGFVEQLAKSIMIADSELLLDKDEAAILAADVACQFYDNIERIIDVANRDAMFTHERDPAASQPLLVPLAYPGIKATTIFRYANYLEAYKNKGVDVGPFARMMTEHAHGLTGIDIHPGATIGECFAVDHGTGVVIGETVIIGNRVAMFAGATLGASRVDPDQSSKRRHPTLEDDVVIYSHATALGPLTIEKGAVIGANTYIFNTDIYANAVVKRLPDGRTVMEHELLHGTVVVEVVMPRDR